MADITLVSQSGAELPAQMGDLHFPFHGNWTSHLTLADAPDPLPSGQVTLRYHGLSLSGYLLRIGTSPESLTTALVVGGAGGLWKVLDPKYYDYQIAVSLPLQEILSAAGERLAATSTATASLPSWPRRQDQAGHLLDTLTEAVGTIWRVLPDGSVFFGTDTWSPPVGFVQDQHWQLLHTDPEWRMQEIAPLSPGVLPGQRFGLGNVGRVHYEDDGDTFVARIWYLDAAGGVDDHVVAGLRALIREETAGTAYHPLLSGQVVQQRADGTLDVQMDDRRLPPLTSVPYLVPVPGASLQVQAGSRCRLAFTSGDPRCPVAQLYEAGQGTKAVGIDGDQVNCGALTVSATAMGTFVWSYVDGLGTTTTGILNQPIPIKGKLIGSAPLKLP